jgi:hypothetical protein
VTPGFDEVHTDHSLAIRSLTEHFETMPFKDQFFFLDACRNIPWANREFEIGRWPIPRQRDPGTPPVQQFILYATSPGLKAHESPWKGAFTGALMEALEGRETSKAWSWERNCYEVRWERLATYANAVMSKRKSDAQKGAAVPVEDVPFQIPQDTGSRGVANRDRDALLVSFPQGHFPSLELTVDFELEPPYKRADISVLDAVGQPVVSALRVGSGPQSFTLPPKTYAVRAVTSDNRIGVLQALERPETALTEIARVLEPSGVAVVETLNPWNLLAAVRPGRTAAEVYRAMSAVLQPAQGTANPIGRMGHGLGLDLTEPPSIAATDETRLEAGMVITLEPCAVLPPGGGMAQRLMVHEENLVVTRDGYALLSRRAAPSLPVV